MSEDSASRMTPLDRWLGAKNFNEPPTLWTGVRTGLTDLSQVSTDLSQVSRRYGLGWANRFRLDIDCVNHHTFLGDRKFFVTRSPSS
jgi:lipopolysaccharide/colanic/teichoic acid biosynthesis glycosyltransferase